MRSFVFASLAVVLLAVACAPKSASVSSPAGAKPAAPAAAPTASAPTASAPPPPAPAAAPSTAASEPAPSGAAAAPAEGRGGRGTPPPPTPPPPSVMPPPVTPIVSATAPTPDPRVGLAAGQWTAAQAAWNMKMVSTTPPAEKFVGVTNSDLAFSGKYAIQGNYNGFQVYDISNPAKPTIAQTYLCPASQNDVSVYKNLLFMSGEGVTGRLDCGIQGVPEPVSKERLRGIRIFDISNMASPKYVANVQTCRGSHTHTVVADPRDKDNVYIYVSGSSGVRSADELPGCADGRIDDPNTARFRLEVIKVPLADPGKAAIVSSPRIFSGLAPPPRRVEPGRGTRSPQARDAAAGAASAAGGAGAPGGGRGPAAAPSGPNQCHDITVVSGDRPRRRRVRRLRPAARHQRRRAPGAHRSGGRHQHVVLALGDVQQRRHEDPVHRRVGRRNAAALPRHRQARVGRRRALHDREQQDELQELLQDAGAADVASRTASRTTDRSSRFRAAK